MDDKPIEICPGADWALDDAEIDPEWIIEGNPRSRSSRWSGSTDGVDANYVWDCTAGRFHWQFGCDETVHIIEGEVEITADGVAPTWLRAGDAALFRAGSTAIWYVPNYVRKHAVLRSELPRLLRVQLDSGRRLKRVVRRALGRSTPVDAQLTPQL